MGPPRRHASDPPSDLVGELPDDRHLKNFPKGAQPPRLLRLEFDAIQGRGGLHLDNDFIKLLPPGQPSPGHFPDRKQPHLTDGVKWHGEGPAVGWARGGGGHEGRTSLLRHEGFLALTIPIVLNPQHSDLGPQIHCGTYLLTCRHEDLPRWGLAHEGWFGGILAVMPQDAE